MKKLTLLCIVPAIATVLSSCGTEKEPATTTTTTTTTHQTAVAAPTPPATMNTRGGY